MSAKIIYFSLDGNTRLVAENISKAISADKLELKLIKQYPTKGFKKYFFGGKDVIFKEKPALASYNKSLKQGLIILGSPIWASTFAPPIYTFLCENDLSGKKVAFFACHGSGGAGKCFEDFKKLQPNAELISTISFFNPLTKDSNAQIEKAVNWASSLI